MYADIGGHVYFRIDLSGQDQVCLSASFGNSSDISTVFQVTRILFQALAFQLRVEKSGRRMLTLRI